MAGGISQALVTTMLGLIVAAPLLFMHSYAENYSKTIISFLEEKSSGIVATKTKKWWAKYLNRIPILSIKVVL